MGRSRKAVGIFPLAGSNPALSAMENYLEISKASDLENKKERILYRLFEILPGFLSWLTLILALFLSYFAPMIVGIFIILFDLYWLFRVAYLSFHQISAFLKMEKNLKVNWLLFGRKNGRI
jgi:hypothetical protein